MFSLFPVRWGNLSYVGSVIDSYTCIHSNYLQERAISLGLWPPRSLDFSSCDYFLWEFLKARFYHNDPRTLDTLKNNIREEIFYFPQSILKVYLLTCFVMHDFARILNENISNRDFKSHNLLIKL